MPAGVYERTAKIRESMSKSRKGKKKTPEVRKNISIGHIKLLKGLLQAEKDFKNES